MNPQSQRPKCALDPVGDDGRFVVAQAMDVPKLLLTIEQAARCLAVSRAHLYRLLQHGELRAVHLGRATRIPAVELERFIARRLSEVMEGLPE